MSVGRAMKFQSSAEAAESFRKSYERRTRKVTRTRPYTTRDAAREQRSSVDTKRLRELCASDDAAWTGDDGNECPSCGTSMYLASPELERRGLCSECSEQLRAAVPGLLDALEARESSPRVATPSKIGPDTLFVRVTVPIRTYRELLDHCVEFELTPQEFIKQALAAAKLSRGGV